MKVEIERAKISSFAKGIFLPFAFGIFVFELLLYFSNEEIFESADAIEIILLFPLYFVSAVFLISLFRGWIIFQFRQD